MPDWPHSPTHSLGASGAYMVTAATYQKEPLFRSARRLNFLCQTLLSLAPQYNWKLEAWAVFPNHYHFIATTAHTAATLSEFIKRLHRVTAMGINPQDEAVGRKVWFQYWDTHLTYERSYFARLNYVHGNAVRHGLARVASQYEWCSAGWFERAADGAFYKTVMNFPSGRVSVKDNFAVDPSDVFGME